MRRNAKQARGEEENSEAQSFQPLFPRVQRRSSTGDGAALAASTDERVIRFRRAEEGCVQDQATLLTASRGGRLGY